MALLTVAAGAVLASGGARTGESWRTLWSARRWWPPEPVP